MGFSTFFETNCARKFEVLLSGPSRPFLSCSQLGPDNNTYLAQIITPQNGFFSIFGFLRCGDIPIFIVFLNINQNWPKKGGENDNFSHFAKHRLIKNPFCCNPPCPKNCCFSTWVFLKPKTLMLSKNIT